MLVYCSLVRLVIDYASPVWAALTIYVEDLLESLQRKALKINFGKIDYVDALAIANLYILGVR